MHLVFCLGLAVTLGCSLGRAGVLPLLLLLRERAKWELPARCRLPFPAPPTSLSLSNSHCTFHDVRIRGRLRSLATACYPPVVLDLRIVEQGRIRGPGHVGVALVDVAVVVALAPLRGQEVESVDSGHRTLGSLLVPARAGCGRSLLTATARGVGALGLDPRIDTGHTVTGGGLLTAPGCAISVRVSLPAGEIGVTASGRTLSRIAHVTASGQADDYLALLPACGRRRQDGWPDERPRRVLGRLPCSLLWFLKRRRLSLLLQEGRFSPRFRLLYRVLPGAFEPVRILFPVAIGGIAGVTASAAGSGGAVCPSTAAGGAVIYLCTAAPAAGSGV